MTGETPNPLDLIRAMGPTHMYRSPEQIERWNAALAQVADVVEAAQELTTPVVASLAHWKALRAALVPFAARENTTEET